MKDHGDGRVLLLSWFHKDSLLSDSTREARCSLIGRNSSVSQNLQFLGSTTGKGRQALGQGKHFSTWGWQKHDQGGQGYVLEYGLQF